MFQGRRIVCAQVRAKERERRGAEGSLGVECCGEMGASGPDHQGPCMPCWGARTYLKGSGDTAKGPKQALTRVM